jgi:type IV fimbrial biogenesis protein FimT
MAFANKQRGVTLLELMVVIAIVAILAAVGLPSMTEMVKNNRVSSARMNFISDLNFARSEAIKRNTRILICSGQADCVNDANWAATGWLVCYDADRNGACDATVAGNPNPILVRAPLQQDIALTGPAAPVVYNAIGSQGSAGAIVDFTLKGSWSSAAAAKPITIAPTGFTTTQ